MNHYQHHLNEMRRSITRRYFFKECGVGLGLMALASLLRNNDVFAAAAPSVADNPFAPRAPHFPAKAKRVIYLFQAGAPSHLELFDYKPELEKRSGQLPPAELLKNYRAAFIKPNSALLGSKYKFARYGRSGMYLSEIIPHHAEVVDD